LNDRQREGGGLARARLGTAEHVASGQNGRDGVGLYGSGLLVPLALQRLEDRHAEAEVGKICQLLVLSKGHGYVGCADNVDAQRNARPVGRTRVSWVVGWNFRGAQQEDNWARVPAISSFTRLEHRKSLMER
jgi:hypothetical protein